MSSSFASGLFELRRMRRLWWLATGVFLTGSIAAGALAGELHQAPLRSLIDQLEQEGYAFVYSRSLVRGDTLIELPDGPLTLSTLQEGMEAIGLTLEQGTNGTWFVVAQRRSPAAVGTMTGRVTDALSGEPLTHVAVEVQGMTVYTDSDGRFEFPAAGASAVLISSDGYHPKEVAARAPEDILNIPLDPDLRIEELVVVSSRYALQRSNGPSAHTLNADELNGIPELGDDALRAANHLPGMATIGISAKPHIRGGLQDELLVLFNNVELLEPFHLKDFQNVFASFNPSLVESVDVYTGGFPARFGDRMSGVMDVQPVTDVSGFRAELMLSFLTASASAAGISQEGRGRWALSARRGNLDLVLDRVDRSTGNPKYSDYFASYAYDLSDDTEIEFGAIAYDDDVRLKDLDEGDGERARSSYENLYAWAQLHRDWSPDTWSSTILSYGTIDHRRDGFINDEDPEEGSSNLDDKRNFDVLTLTHRQYVDVSELLALEVGGRLAYQSGDYDSREVIGRGVLGDIIGLPPVEIREVDTSPSGTTGGLYSSLRIRPQDWLTFELGARWDYQDYGDDFDQQFSPRLSTRIDLTATTQLRFSAGRFYQPEQIHELPAADGIDRFQAPQYADHYIVGLDQTFGATGLSLRVEAFHKNVRDTKRRFENLFNPFVLLPEIASDRIEVSPTRARARGFEVSLGYEPTARLNSWLSYSYSSSDDRIDGEWQPRGWDQEHTVSSGVIWTPGNWTLSAAVLWHSGWRTTGLPDTFMEGELPDLERNGDLLPDYLSLDVKIARAWNWEKQSLTLFAEVTNLLDHSNVGAYEYDIAENEDGGGYVVEPERFTLLPLVPSIGVRWAFE